MLAVGALTACQVGQKSSSGSEASSSGDTSTPDSSKSSEQPSSEESSSEEPPAPTRDWTNEEKALMEQHLHGIVLPFLDVEGIALSFDETTEQFSTGALTIEDGTIAAYAELFDESEGWNDVSYQYDTYETAPAGSFYVFERFVQTQEGKRGISVRFFGNDGTNYTTAGPMYLFANDPFDYEFPDLAAEYAQYNVDGAPIPAPNIQDLYFEFYPNSNNAAYHSYGMDEYLNATIYIYGLDEDGFLAYVQQCISAGWIIEEGEEPDTYVAKLINEQDNTQFVADVYYSEDYVAISFYYLAAELPITSWPSEMIAEAFEEHEKALFDVPAFNGEGFEYEFYDNFSYGYIGIYVSNADADDLVEYAAALTTAGWEVVEEDGVYTATLELTEGIAKISFEYDDRWEQDYFRIFYDLEAYPSAEWPTADVAALLASLDSSITDVLPAYEYAPAGTVFQIYNDSFGAGVKITLADGETEQGTIELYAYYLTEAGFTAVEGKDGFYASPNNQYLVEVYSGEVGYVCVEISLIAKFPSDKVLEGLALMDESFTDPIPALEGADSYRVFQETTQMQIQCVYSSLAEAQAAVAAYEALLLAANYTNPGQDAYGWECYNSPNEQFYLNIWISSQSGYKVIIDVYPGTFVDPSIWPADKIAQLLGASVTDTVLPVEGAISFDAYAGSYSTVQIAVNCADATALLATYTAALLEAGWTEAGADDYGDMHYTSPNAQLDLCPWISSGMIVIDVDVL